MDDGSIPLARIDAAARAILRAKFALGLFENRYSNAERVARTLLCAAHLELALEASRKALVLLKNTGDCLPLKKPKRLLVTGPNADDQSILGDWARLQPAANIVTILRGIRELAPSGSSIEHVAMPSLLRISQQQIRRRCRRRALS